MGGADVEVGMNTVFVVTQWWHHEGGVVCGVAATFEAAAQLAPGTYMLNNQTIDMVKGALRTWTRQEDDAGTWTVIAEMDVK